ncbi:MAG: fused response regulator/phosphatase [Gammaproteobacteria bacterium]|nr:fused response regulator/phosphatase [Gammaproteobacteria bacterium]
MADGSTPQTTPDPLRDVGQSASGGATRVLIADDDHVNRLILKAILAKEGYAVEVAENGHEAVEKFSSWAPDLVLMDIMMPVLDGYEATRQIKQQAGDTFVPVIFLTALSDESALARCVAVGGDDFLTKPYSRVILKAKIDALERVRRLHVTLRQQRDELAGHQRRLLQEHQVAEKVLAKIVHSGSLDAPQIKYLLSPMAIFNGDMLLAARKPSGGLHVMLGDFTGHGLSAAIGTVPVADIFYGMTDKGFSIGDILATINDKLRVILPTDVFFAAALLELDAGHSKLTLWNGGIPDVAIRRHDGRIETLSSDHLPLGVVENHQLDRGVRVVEVEEGDRIIVYSDGFIEARSPEGEMFGLERLVASLGGVPRPEMIFDGLLRTLGDFVGEGALGDDLSLIEITCDSRWAETRSEVSRSFQPRPPMRWSIAIELVPETLRTVDPLPLVMHMLMDLQGLQEHREQLYAVLMELFSNALDHGLLRLDSKLKQTPEGFAQYYELRKQRLAELDHGSVRVELEHEPDGSGGCLRFTVEDDGPGFDPSRVFAPLEENLSYYGRGIPLLRSICERLEYSGNGNHAEAVYRWTGEGANPTPRTDG